MKDLDNRNASKLASHGWINQEPVTSTNKKINKRGRIIGTTLLISLLHQKEIAPVKESQITYNTNLRAQLQSRLAIA